ncbi:MAG: phenylalanine--tRNA ligase subunit beta [Buchnera aphidicola (Kaburagia rhusicola rhusicola)]
MEFSERWLREWINPDVNIRLLCNQMTELGLEVEKVTKISSMCTNLIVGEIIKCLVHYNTAQLLLVKISIGNNVCIQVVSRYVSFTKGDKVVIATTNSRLFDNTFFKLVELQAIKNDGIICFHEDLGITNIDSSIIMLPFDAAVGSNACEYLSLDDHIIKISSTPNRSDALSILGIARDLAAWNNLPLPYLQKYFNVVKSTEKLEILINIPDICHRFFGRIMTNIDATVNTPFWMLERLKRSSIKSSNVIVNIINYVLIELGQPLYVINLSSISDKIIIRKSYKNENFVSDSNQKILIDSDTLVVSDEEKILVLGGHVNSCISKIDFDSKSLFLGCGLYANPDISKQSFKYGCKNAFTNCYARGVDATIQHEVLEYATYLILKLCCGKASVITSKISSTKIFNQIRIKLYRKKLYKIIGHVISDESIIYNLTKLGFKVIVNDQYLLIFPPSWRLDINIEEDVIGELLRIIGYKKIFSVPISTRSHVICDDQVYTLLNRAKLFLVDQGYHEIITYGFVDPKLQQLLFPDIVPLHLSNPISRDMSSMRVSLWPGLLSSIIYNQNRQENRLRFFESGLCFLQNSKKNLGVEQILHFSGILSGYRDEFHWDVLEKKSDFYDLKGNVESVLDVLGKLHLVTFKKFYIPGLHPSQSVAIYLKNKIIGFMGSISPNLEKKLDLKYRTVVFELMWNKISSLNYTKITTISEYPRSIRDISIIVDEVVPVRDIILACKKSSFEAIVEINLFDIFRGSQIGIGKKSLALRLTFENKNKTFTEQEVSKILQKCIETLKLKFNAQLR